MSKMRYQIYTQRELNQYYKPIPVFGCGTDWTAIVHLAATFIAEQFSTICNFRSCAIFMAKTAGDFGHFFFFYVSAFVTQRKQVQSD